MHFKRYALFVDVNETKKQLHPDFAQHSSGWLNL